MASNPGSSTAASPWGDNAMPDTIETRAYRSKIGRLPFAVRNELCERMRDGATGSELCAWLNKLKANKSLNLAPINDQNITDWRGTGYAAWLKGHERAQHLRDYTEVAQHIAAATGGDPTAVGARILAGRMLDMLESVDEETAEGFSNAVSKLRKGENDAQKLDLEKQKTEIARQALDLEKRKFQRTTAELFIKWHADHKAVAILDDATLDNDRKTEALGKLMFAELWDDKK